MGEAFDFYQDHSIRYLEMALSADRHETPTNPDGYGRSTGQCGDTVEIYLCVGDDRLDTVSYSTDGCLNTNACANAVVHLAEGRTVDEAWEITPETVAEFLETLPQDHFHCAELAVGALYRALANYREMTRAPWKKAYRKP